MACDYTDYENDSNIKNQTFYRFNLEQLRLKSITKLKLTNTAAMIHWKWLKHKQETTPLPNFEDDK